jgi:hypothetical protein
MFVNPSGDLLSAAITLLANTDGVPGNASTNIDIDTVFSRVGATTWFGLAAEEGHGALVITVRSYGVRPDPEGTLTYALCGDNSGNGAAFQNPADVCRDMAGLGSQRLVIPDEGNQLGGVPPSGPFPKLGVAVSFRCPQLPGTLEIQVAQSPLPVSLSSVTGPWPARSYRPLPRGSRSSHSRARPITQ